MTHIDYRRATLRRETHITRPVVHRIECHIDGCGSGATTHLPAGDDPTKLEYTCPYHNGFVHGGGQGKLRRRP